MTPERLAELERWAREDTHRDLIAHIRDLEAQVREARKALTAATKRSGQVINNWVTGGEDVCLVCGQIPNPDTHDEQCWVPLALAFLATATPPSLSAKERQRRSFAYGNVHIDNPNVTREMVDRAAERLASEPPSPEVGE